MKIFKVKFASGMVKKFLDKTAAENYMKNAIGNPKMTAEWINAEDIEKVLKQLA